MEQSGWCPDNAVCMDWIERRALHCLENNIEADTIYMSNDIYKEFMQQMAAYTRLHSPQTYASGYTITCIQTSAGQLKVKSVPLLCNFCYVGSETSFKRLEWEQVSQKFEEAFFGEEND